VAKGQAILQSEALIFRGNFPDIGASTVGLLGSSPTHGPLLATSALYPGRTDDFHLSFAFKDVTVVKAGSKTGELRLASPHGTAIFMLGSLADEWASRIQSNPAALAVLPLSLSLLLLFGWAVSVLAGYVNAAFRDVQHLSNIGFQLLFYLMPIIYPPNSPPPAPLDQLFYFNPLIRLLNIVRMPIIDGQIPPLKTYLIATLATLFV